MRSRLSVYTGAVQSPDPDASRSPPLVWEFPTADEMVAAATAASHEDRSRALRATQAGLEAFRANDLLLALTRLERAASSLGFRVLAEWARFEAEGFPPDGRLIDLPEYRKPPAVWVAGNGRRVSLPLPSELQRAYLPDSLSQIVAHSEADKIVTYPELIELAEKIFNVPLKGVLVTRSTLIGIASRVRRYILLSLEMLSEALLELPALPIEPALPSKEPVNVPKSPRVLISYSWDSDDHQEKVLRLATALKRDGVDCRIDQWDHVKAEGLPRWMEGEITAADYVLCICTEFYRRRFEGREEPGKGLGGAFEGKLIATAIMEASGKNAKFIPVLFSEDDKDHRPTVLRDTLYHLLSDQAGYDKLYRLLTDQPAVIAPPLGGVVKLTSSDVAPLFETPGVPKGGASDPQ